MEVIWGHILKSPRVILNLITPHCILLYFLDIFSLIFASLYNIQCWFHVLFNLVRHVPSVRARVRVSMALVHCFYLGLEYYFAFCVFFVFSFSFSQLDRLRLHHHCNPISSWSYFLQVG